MRVILPAAALVAFACSTSGCVTWRSEIAGSIPLAAGQTRSLELRAPEPKELRIELWNRGPGVVTFRSFDANGNVHTHGPLDPGTGEIRMQAAAELMAIEVTADAQGATVAYAIRSRGSVTATMRDGAYSRSR
jgi:hypothetical protein